MYPVISQLPLAPQCRLPGMVLHPSTMLCLARETYALEAGNREAVAGCYGVYLHLQGTVQSLSVRRLKGNRHRAFFLSRAAHVFADRSLFAAI